MGDFIVQHSENKIYCNLDIIQAIPLSRGKYKLVDIDIVLLLDIVPVGFKNPDQFKDLVFFLLYIIRIREAFKKTRFIIDIRQ